MVSGIAPRIARGIVALVSVTSFTFALRPASAQESKVQPAREAASRSPVSPAARLALGVALRKAGHGAEALTELHRGLAQGPTPALAQALLWESSRAHVDLHAFAPATAACRELGRLPGAASARQVCLAEAHLLWRRATEATVELEKLGMKGAPSLTADVAYAASMALGRARELEGRDAEAADAYRGAAGRAPARAEPHVALGVLIRRAPGRTGSSDADGALAELRRAVELDPADPEAELELGRALPVGSAEALEAFERAAAERPEYADALRALAEAYVLAGRLPEAKRAAEAALKVAPHDPVAQVALGRALLGEDKPDDAIRAGAVAFERTKNFAGAKLLVADANAKKGEIDLAIEAYQAAVGLDRTDPTALLRATEACLRSGRTTSAKAFAERATRDFPDHAAGWEVLGDALAADGEPLAARKVWSTAKTKPGADIPSLDRKLTGARVR